MTKEPFSGNLADLVTPAARNERARLEAETRAKIDGRKLRKKGRTEQMAFRFTPERRAQIERLALLHGCTFAEIVEKGLDLLEKHGK